MDFFTTGKTIWWPYCYYQGGITEVLLLTQKHFVQLFEDKNGKELCLGNWGRWLVPRFYASNIQSNNLCRVIEIKIWFLKSCTRKKYTASAHRRLCMNMETSVCMWGRNLLGWLGKRKKEDISVSLGFPNSDEKKKKDSVHWNMA